ncbi:phenylalanine--tRNA ligase subunit alpha [Candidatus Woesearchaeota archaeon]|nr:MAG: phenylalanine--tRNA ligase subunit alpha [Candidatus Woesearchaeota archaeon]
MNIDKIIDTLHPLERAVLPALSNHNKFEEIVFNSKLKDIEVMRALQWLQNKGIVESKQESKEIISLDQNGKKYLVSGLPERKFLELIKEKEMPLSSIMNEGKFQREELNVCIGVLKGKAAISVEKGKELLVSITEQGRKLLEKEFLEEKFLKKDFPLEISQLTPEERFAFQNLLKRKNFLRVENKKVKYFFLTDLGKQIIEKGLGDSEIIDSLTPSMIKDGSWRNKKFRRYDIKVNVPKTFGGKRHFVSQAIEYAKRIWLDMGFKEMTGPIIQTSFWNFDALFTAQDHPVRDLQDTFYIKDPAHGKLPKKELVMKVRKAHEEGVAGSTGWNYSWNQKEATKNVLRTHTTVLSARTIAALKKDELPAKYFSVAKCFRNETLDWSHLFEFNQTEGIVVDENANFRHLLGYLKEFFAKMGFPKARFRPAYFPYTEPSVEIDVLHPVHKEWVELGGAGIFRPEVVVPLLGKDIPVLAWGPGFDRIILDYYKINDIRELYKNDLNQLRTIRAWMK